MKKSLKFLSLILGLSLLTSAKAYASTTTHRIAGNDRYDTAIEISKNGWSTGSDYVVLAYGENFPDALCAAPLAKKYNAPILLNPGNTLDSRVQEELLRLKVKQVFIIGGIGVVPQAIEDSLLSQNIKVIRLGGQDRYETSVKVAEQLDFNKEIVIATGEDYPDALSIAPIAAQKSMPILLTPYDDLPDSVVKYISDKEISKSYIIGGYSVISYNLNSKYFPNAIRLSGDSRYSTNMAVIDYFASSINIDTIYLTSGDNFPDALSGAALAAKQSRCMILAGDCMDTTARRSIFTKLNYIKNVEVLGGTGAVFDSRIKNVIYPSGDDIDVLAQTYSKIKKDGMYYYSSYLHYTDPNYRVPLSKCSEDGLTRQQLSDKHAGQINVDGDWVYFVSNGLYRVKTDGTGETIISSDVDHVYWYTISNNKIIYYCDTEASSSGKNAFTIMDLDGSNKLIIPADGQIISTNIDGDFIYYINYSSATGKQEMYRMKFDGSEKTMLLDQSFNPYAMQVYNGFIYYSVHEDGSYLSLYRMKLDGSEKSYLCPINNAFAVSNGRIYYDYMTSMFSMNLDGSYNTILHYSYDIPICNYYVKGSYIYVTHRRYFTGDESPHYSVVRTSLDGGGAVPIIN